MKIVKLIIPLLLLALIIWIDFPENIHVNQNVLGKKVDFTINPPTLDLSRFGINYKKEFVTKLGLDLKGGSHLLYDVDTSSVKSSDVQEALNSAKDIIERRVNLFGVSEPTVQTLKYSDKYRISVDLPGIENVSQAIGLIGATAQLSFRLEDTSSESAKIATNTPLFARMTKETGLTGKDVKKATVTFNPQTGKPEVSLSFTDKGTKLFAQITSENVGKPVGIFLDYMPISIPVVQTPILDGNAVINGTFTAQDAKELAVAINSGALPLPIKLIEQRNIGPTLGASEVHKSIVAGVIGLSMVMLFMILYYGRLGVIACIALIIYGLISFAIFRAIPVVLTLPGVAGFILSIGMAVDTNILIFERIKEERRKGRDFNASIRMGFGRAIDAIKDANITTLIVAFILFNPANWEFLPQFGLVRGFALTLAIGVLTSLFTGLVITKRLIQIFYKQKQTK